MNHTELGHVDTYQALGLIGQPGAAESGELEALPSLEPAQPDDETHQYDTDHPEVGDAYEKPSLGEHPEGHVVGASTT